MIQASAFDFITDLKSNNNRDWFNAHKDRYQAEHTRIVAFADELLGAMRHHDDIATKSGKASLFRIYADTRFSKEKAPYKTHWSGSFSRATAYLRGGYYFHLEPGNSFMAGGFFGPNADDLKRIREDISLNYEDWDVLFANPQLQKQFGSLSGTQVKTAPKGFDKEHPGIQWLRFKQFILQRSFTDAEVLHPDFVHTLNDAFKGLRPFLDFMSEVLTTDSNGELIV